MTFEREVPDPHLQYQCVDIHVKATSVKEAQTKASRIAVEMMTHRLSMPRDIANFCWCRDSRKDGYGFIAAQWSRRDNKLSVPYYMTNRLKITVTLGNLPLQLEFDFE